MNAVAVYPFVYISIPAQNRTPNTSRPDFMARDEMLVDRVFSGEEGLLSSHSSTYDPTSTYGPR